MFMEPMLASFDMNALSASCPSVNSSILCGNVIMYATQNETLTIALREALAVIAANPSAQEAEDPCAPAALSEAYNQGLHIAGIFIILAASLIGTILPLIGKYIRSFSVPAFYLVIGKTTGTGIVLAASCIHMLLPAVESLSSECLPAGWHEYEAYAYLFMMLGALFMHAIDFIVDIYVTNIVSNNNQKNKDKQACHEQNANNNHKQASAVNDKVLDTVTILVNDNNNTNARNNDIDNTATEMTHFNSVKTDHDVDIHSHSHGIATDDDHEGHAHSILLIEGVQKTVSAYLLEFAVTIHSIFIGVTTGLASQAEFKTLLVALSFHQAFEGIALGSRVAEAHMKSYCTEIVFVLVFSISAPIGMMIGVLVSSSLNTSSVDFLLVQGIFDAVCAGFLLYISFILLLKDFPVDFKMHTKNSTFRKLLMFAALYTGAAFMAYIGKFL